MNQVVNMILDKFIQMEAVASGNALSFRNLTTIRVDGQKIPMPDLQSGIEEAIKLGWLKQGKIGDSFALTDEGAAQL